MKSFDRRQFLKLSAGTVAAATLGIRSAEAAPMELKFGHVGKPGSLFEKSAQHFAKLANERLKGRAKVTVYGSSQLGDDMELLQKVRLGTVDFSLPSSVMSSIVPAFGLFEMPYLVKDRGQMKRIKKAIVWPTLAPLARQHGYEIVAVWENGFRQITNNVRPIYKPQDLKGIKLRVPKDKWRVKMFEAYGANPSPMPFSEVFTALKTHVMDGEENPLIQIYSAKFYEVQKYLSMTDHVYTPAYVVTSPRTWKSLPDDVRKTLAQTAKETTAYVYRTAAALDHSLKGKLISDSMHANNADKKAFIQASGPIYKEFGQQVHGGEAMIKKAMSLRNA